MILKANIIEAVRSLTGSKQRTFLALLGIVIGIGSVIAMVSVGNFVKYEALKQFKDMGTDILQIKKDGMAVEKRSRALVLEEVQALPIACPELALIAPYLTQYSQVKYKKESSQVPVMGVSADFKTLFKIPQQQGRFISDLDRNMSFCVISQKVVQMMAEGGIRQPLGEQMIINDKRFTIIGTIGNVPSGGMRPYEINAGIMIPITTALRFRERPQIQNIMAQLKPDGSAVVAADQIQGYLKQITPNSTFRVTSAEELIAKMEKQMQLFTLLLAAIGSISLIVGGVGVMNVMLVSVAERKKEIGIRRALGATKMDIQYQFLIESMILCLLGGVLGVALGLGSSYLIAQFSNWQFMIFYEAVMAGFGVSALVGVLFGFLPARQAAGLNPIEALRAD